MASFHCDVKVGQKGLGLAHADYVARAGLYHDNDRYEDLVATNFGNMPMWAQHDPREFWKAADEYERHRGSSYREYVLGLPNELTHKQNEELVEEFIKRSLGKQKAYLYGIHDNKAAFGDAQQIHCHLMFSDRMIDRIERDPKHYFKKADHKIPERGGCRKDNPEASKAYRAEKIIALRKLWADTQNGWLAKYGHDTRVTHLSLKDQGIDRIVEPHFGPVKVAKMSEEQRVAVIDARLAKREWVVAEAELVMTVTDVQVDIDEAKKARIDQNIAYAARRLDNKVVKAESEAEEAKKKPVSTWQEVAEKNGPQLEELRNAPLAEVVQHEEAERQHKPTPRAAPKSSEPGNDGPGT